MAEDEVKSVHEVAINGEAEINGHSSQDGKRNINLLVQVSEVAGDDVERVNEAAITGNLSQDRKHDIDISVQVSGEPGDEVERVNEAVIDGGSSQGDHSQKRDANLLVKIRKVADDEVERVTEVAVSGEVAIKDNPIQYKKRDPNFLVQVSKMGEEEVKRVNQAAIQFSTDYGELEETDDGLNPFDFELPSSSAFYRVIRAGGRCDPPGINNDVCEPGTECLLVPGEGIKRCVNSNGTPTRSIIPGGGACVAGRDVCVTGYSCINRMCVIRNGGVCSVRDICQSGYSCVNGFCGTSSKSVICGADSDCISGEFCFKTKCIIAPTGTCTINCNCFNNDCGMCGANCNCFGTCCMPRCTTGCNYNGGNYCPFDWLAG